MKRALLDPYIHDNAPVAVVVAVEDQSLQRCVRIALGSGNICDDALHDLLDVDTHFRGDQRRVLSRYAYDIFYLGFDFIGARGYKVDLVDNGNDLKILLHSKVGICKRLSFYAL